MRYATRRAFAPAPLGRGLGGGGEIFITLHIQPTNLIILAGKNIF